MTGYIILVHNVPLKRGNEEACGSALNVCEGKKYSKSNYKLFSKNNVFEGIAFALFPVLGGYLLEVLPKVSLNCFYDINGDNYDFICKSAFPWYIIYIIHIFIYYLYTNRPFNMLFI